MPLMDDIQAQMKDAMRSKDALRLNTLRMLKTAVMYAATESGRAQEPPGDEVVLQAVRKEIKKREDAIGSFRDAGREAQAAQEEAEKLILEGFLPPPLGAEELHALVAEAVRAAGATSRKDMGAVMKLLQASTGGRVDGKTLSQAVQAALS